MFLRKSRESRKDSAVRSAIEASRPARAAGRERGTSDQGARDVQGGRRRQPWPSAAASSAAVGSVSSRPRRRRRGWGGGTFGSLLPPPCAPLPLRLRRLLRHALRAVVSRLRRRSFGLQPLRSRVAASGRLACGALPVARRCERSGL